MGKSGLIHGFTFIAVSYCKVVKILVLRNRNLNFPSWWTSSANHI